MANILIIDDDDIICDMLSAWVGSMGHFPDFCHTREEGLRKVGAKDFDVVLLDVHLPDGNGLEILPKIKSAASNPEVIIITGLKDSYGAEIAIRSGAWDYIQKPVSKEEMILPIRRAIQFREKNVHHVPVVLKRDEIIGNSPSIKAHLEKLCQATQTDANVLVTGESGTGKELFAKAIHQNSARAKKNFVVVDCAALPEKIVESLLFGHTKGAFTGADRTEDGLIRHADGGTLFLDEIGELPPDLQKSFLRVIQERQYRPVGSKTEEVSDFRLIAATNRDLEEMVKSGKFRQDLLFRINSLVIELSPLRMRTGDVRELTIHYMRKICDRNGVREKGISPDFVEALQAYDWPGNIRELANTLERAVSAAHAAPILFPQHLPNSMRIKLVLDSVAKKQTVAPTNRDRSPETEAVGNMPPLKDVRDAHVAQAERKYLGDLMAATGGNMAKACKISGLSRARLYEILKKYGISPKSA